MRAFTDARPGVVIVTPRTAAVVVFVHLPVDRPINDAIAR